jgi:bifunctional DNA-binding transcriptional regulator/antitoxin component of YhaV-PrlF toxin-antitoxin module
MQERGQVTVPIEFRKDMGLEKGDLIAFEKVEQGLLLRPQEVIAMEALDLIGDALEKRGITLEELINDGREIRSRLIEEEYGITADEQ